VTLVAWHDRAQDEELTADSAMWEADEPSVMRSTCACGSPLCRGRVTGLDWRRPKLQQRDRGHCSPFINERIARRTIGEVPADPPSHAPDHRDPRDERRPRPARTSPCGPDVTPVRPLSMIR